MQWHKSSDISQIVISLVLRTRAITCDMPLLAIALPYNTLALCRAVQTPSHSFGRYHARPSELFVIRVIALFGRCDIGVILLCLLCKVRVH